MKFKELLLREGKRIAWDIKKKMWINANPSYEKAQEDIVDDLKKINNKKDAIKIVNDEFPNRDFDIVDGNKLLVSFEDKK